MKHVVAILCCAATFIISQEPQMIIHRTSGVPLNVAITQIDSITFSDTVSVRTLVSTIYDPYMQFKAAQYVYEAEMGVFANSFDQLGLSDLFVDSSYFTFSAVGSGAIEATLKKSVQGFDAGSKIGMKLSSFADSVTYYGVGSFDSTTVDSAFRQR